MLPTSSHDFTDFPLFIDNVYLVQYYHTPCTHPLSGSQLYALPIYMCTFSKYDNASKKLLFGIKEESLVTNWVRDMKFDCTFTSTKRTFDFYNGLHLFSKNSFRNIPLDHLKSRNKIFVWKYPEPYFQPCISYLEFLKMWIIRDTFLKMKYVLLYFKL